MDPVQLLPCPVDGVVAVAAAAAAAAAARVCQVGNINAGVEQDRMQVCRRRQRLDAVIAVPVFYELSCNANIVYVCVPK